MEQEFTYACIIALNDPEELVKVRGFNYWGELYDLFKHMGVEDPDWQTVTVIRYQDAGLFLGAVNAGRS